MSTRNTGHEAAIRKHAERMWREDGSPPGRLDEYLERARELQAMVDHPGVGRLPNPMTAHHGEIEPEQPIEEAELQNNLGEFPSLLTDQGERLATPMTRKAARRARKEG